MSHDYHDEKEWIPKKDELRILKIYLGYLATVFSIIAAAYFFGG